MAEVTRLEKYVIEEICDFGRSHNIVRMVKLEELCMWLGWLKLEMQSNFGCEMA
jgi:hypothetical protein